MLISKKVDCSLYPIVYTGEKRILSSQLQERKITVDEDLFEWSNSGKDLVTDSKVRTKLRKSGENVWLSVKNVQYTLLSWRCLRDVFMTLTWYI